MKAFITEQRNTYRMSMEELQKAVRSGAAKEQLKVHDRFLFVFDGKLAAFEVIGLDAEKLADPELKHSVTLMAVDLIGENRPFDEDGNNKWDKSSLRAYLQSEKFMQRFEEDVKKYVAPVIKTTNENMETKDLFFILSKEEAEGGYPAFKTERDRIKVNPDGETDWYFLRSAYRGNASYTWYVNSSGYVNNYYASVAYRFAQAFTIA